MFPHVAALTLVGVAFLSLVYSSLAVARHLPGINGVPVPMRRGVERAVLVIVSAALIIGMLVAFSPSVKQVEASLDSSLDQFIWKKRFMPAIVHTR
jgi:hypothetical protein